MTVEERFWEKVDRSGGPKACWPWVGGMTSGYGVLRVDGNPEAAHHFSYILHHGPYLSTLCVLHLCHNRACVNPRHLMLGTKGDNNLQTRESNRHRSLFSPEEILAIRQAEGTMSASKLAKTYKVTKTTILNIWAKRTHNHI